MKCFIFDNKEIGGISKTKDIQMIVCTVLGKKMGYAGEKI